MSVSGEAKSEGLTLVGLLAEARRSEAARIDAETIIQAFRLHNGAPHRKGPYLRTNRGKTLAGPLTNRREERLAKELMQQGALTLPNETKLQLRDYQFPLKSVRSDKIGKIDLIGLTEQNQLTLIELKIAESIENPRIALLEALAYWAVVRGNLARINEEFGKRGPRPDAGPGRLLIMAPDAYWRRWLEPKRKQRWLRFCYLVHEVQCKVDARIECLVLHDHAKVTPRFTVSPVSTGMEGFTVTEDGSITDAGFFDDH